MGIVNVTPDSFSDGGLYVDPARAVEHGTSLIEQGADLLDIGGESTRPGARPVPVAVEAKRVVEVIRGLRQLHPDVLLSVDTSKASVAAQALEAGAGVVNDVTALGDVDMARVVADTGADLVLMHMRGEPRTMQRDTSYPDLLGEVREYLSARMDIAVARGVSPGRITVDPGVGFGKAWSDNPRLIAGLKHFRSLGAPVLVGASRKGFIGVLTGQGRAVDRVFGSVGAALAATVAGVDILRVHDVTATREALAVFLPCQHTESPS
jgi:dihydropteroate synthase